MTAAGPVRRALRAAGTVLRHALGFALMGPPIGGLIVVIVFLFPLALSPERPGLGDLPVLVVIAPTYSVLGGYVCGIPAAALTGALVGGLRLAGLAGRRPAGRRLDAAGAAIGAAVSALMTWPIGGVLLQGPVSDDFAMYAVPLVAVAGAVAGWLCTATARTAADPARRAADRRAGAIDALTYLGVGRGEAKAAVDAAIAEIGAGATVRELVGRARRLVE